MKMESSFGRLPLRLKLLGSRMCSVKESTLKKKEKLAVKVARHDIKKKIRFEEA